MKTTLTLMIAVMLTGCAAPKTAVIDGKEVLRPTLGYTDHDLFAIQHQRAWPQTRGASSGLHAFGGALWGRVCGADVNLDAVYRGRYLDVTGFVSPPIAFGGGRTHERPIHLEARDHDGYREVIGFSADGGINGPYGPPVIDFKYNHDALEGQIGWRHFKLHREDDRLVGTMTEIDDTIPFEVNGADELWLMPAPDQVALLPFMMTCGYKHGFERSSAGRAAQLPIDFRNLVVSSNERSGDR